MKTDTKLKALADGVSMIFDALESGKITAEQLRARLAEQPSDEAHTLGLCLDIAIELHKAPRAPSRAPAPAVKNPRYRKGTAMQPAKWTDCLWRPTP